MTRNRGGGRSMTVTQIFRVPGRFGLTKGRKWGNSASQVDIIHTLVQTGRWSRRRKKKKTTRNGHCHAYCVLFFRFPVCVLVPPSLLYLFLLPLSRPIHTSPYCLPTVGLLSPHPHPICYLPVVGSPTHPVLLESFYFCLFFSFPATSN